MTSDERPGADARNETHLDRAGDAGDELARAVDRHRDELDMPLEPADGEDVDSSRE